MFRIYLEGFMALQMGVCDDGRVLIPYLEEYMTLQMCYKEQ